MDTPRKKAALAGELFYFGKLCREHPELGGKRRTLANACPECQKIIGHNRAIKIEANGKSVGTNRVAAWRAKQKAKLALARGG